MLCTLIRQEGCQLWVLCFGLNSQNGPLNWTLSCRGVRQADPAQHSLMNWGVGEDGGVWEQQATCVVEGYAQRYG